MSTVRAEGYSERFLDFPPNRIRVVSYRIGARYSCTVDNVDPGAVFARASALTREEAERLAVLKARVRLSKQPVNPTIRTEEVY